MKHNSWKRRALAALAIVLLSVPSAIGVFRALAPTRGPIAAALAAAGFEVVYISTSILLLYGDLRDYAQRVAFASVTTAVVLNVLADYSERVPGGLSSMAQFVARFDVLVLVLSVVESAPLAGLAYAMATPLHRLSEAESKNEPKPADPLPAGLLAARPGVPAQPIYAPPMPAQPEALLAVGTATRACPKCGETLTQGQYGAAKRYGYCAACKEV